MKGLKRWALLLALLCLCGAARAEALPEEKLAAFRQDLEMFHGYTPEETEAFVFERVEDEQDERLLISGYLPEEPLWRFLEAFDPETSNRPLLSPYKMRWFTSSYPNSETIRHGLRLLRTDWLPHWEDGGSERMSAWLAERNLQLPTPLYETASEALSGFLFVCFSDPYAWPQAVWQWEAETRSELNLPSREFAPISNAVTRYTRLYSENGAKVQVTRFGSEAPREWEALFAHSSLDGWTLLCGVCMEREVGNSDNGLAAFEQDGRRLLVSLQREKPDGDWRMYSMGETALYADRPFFLTEAANLYDFNIVYPISEREYEWFTVDMGTPYCCLSSYTHINEGLADCRALFFDASEVQTCGAAGQRVSEPFAARLPRLLPWVRIDDVPTTREACLAAQPPQRLPEGYGVVCGVHLREKTSSRSKDLGLYPAGVPVEILGTEPGNPDDWYHVRIGHAEGYMSSHYVTFDEEMSLYQDGPQPAALPVGRTLKDVKLKGRAGWFAETLETLPAGTCLQVLAERGGWLHVSIPEGEMSWMRNVNDRDGFVRKREVQIFEPSLMNP